MGRPSETENWRREPCQVLLYVLCPSPKELEMRVRSKGFGQSKSRGQTPLTMQVQEQSSFREHRHGCGKKWRKRDKGSSHG